MARKSIIEPIREYLEEIHKETQKWQESAARSEQFREAGIYKGFKESINRVIQLCGKPKEGKKENE